MARDARRILDANANRAREGARVLEEAARFLMDDAKLSQRCKCFRHDLRNALASFGPTVGFRDTPADVGTSNATPGEYNRQNVGDVVAASSKRLAEALRCCEEYGKIFDAKAAARMEKLRYRAYALESDLLKALPAAPQWRLCVILTEALCTHHPWHRVAEAAVDAGADCLQLREKDLGDRPLLRRAKKLLRLAEGLAHVVVNDRVDVAAAAGADGVHLGQDDLPMDLVQKHWPGRLIGVSTHSLAEATKAVAGGCDYCGVGAIHATPTKPRQASGLKYLRQFRKAFPKMPHLAIGGIGVENVADVVAAGAQGVAVSSAVCGAKRPGAVVRKLLKHLPQP